jgi:hypothetical protein
MGEYSIKWEPALGIDTPCAGLSIHYESSNTLRVVMHFSRVNGGRKLDLELIFTGPIALRWVDECYGSIFHPIPGSIPKCPRGPWSEWTFPLLQVKKSSWLAAYQRIPELPGSQVLQHFALVCMNDLLDIAAPPDVEARWVTPT